MIKKKVESNFYGEQEFLINDKTGDEYQRTVGGLGWPWGDKAGFAVIIAEERENNSRKPNFFVLAEHEDFNVSNLLRACVAFRGKYFASQFYGDTTNEPMMQNYYRFKTSFPLTSPPFLDDVNSLNSYIATIRELTLPGRKRLHFSGSNLGTRLLEIPAEKIRRATRAQDFPILAALGGALSAMITWKFDPKEQYTIDVLNDSLIDQFDD
jgi:hypothetical protein